MLVAHERLPRHVLLCLSIPFAVLLASSDVEVVFIALLALVLLQLLHHVVAHQLLQEVDLVRSEYVEEHQRGWATAVGFAIQQRQQLRIWKIIGGS